MRTWKHVYIICFTLRKNYLYYIVLYNNIQYVMRAKVLNMCLKNSEIY